jgi:glycine cleavage system aminomethyltransferase T
MALAAWLQHEQATEAVMESTAQYWRPVWYGLEPHFKLHLSHPLKDPCAARTQAGPNNGDRQGRDGGGGIGG